MIYTTGHTADEPHAESYLVRLNVHSPNGEKVDRNRVLTKGAVILLNIESI